MSERLTDVLAQLAGGVDQIPDVPEHLRRLLREARRLASEQNTWVPPGHFYSPIVDPAEVGLRRSQLFDRSRPPIDVDMREDAQIELFHRLSPHYRHLPFSEERKNGVRYYYSNPAFSSADAIILACILMEMKPKRVLEIGSGFSSCVTMDVNDLFLGGRTQVTFVEPHPDLLYSLMTESDRARYAVHPVPVQDIDLAVVDELEAGDVLFIDSTHVSKMGSDVNFEFFEIFPRLKSGVIIHLHDIFYPFEYIEQWVFRENRSWNELYLLRAFLSGNSDFEVMFFNHFMYLRHKDLINGLMPRFVSDPGGSFWMLKR